MKPTEVGTVVGLGVEVVLYAVDRMVVKSAFVDVGVRDTVDVRVLGLRRSSA